MSLILLVDAGNNLHEGGLTSTVQTYNADFGSVEEGEVDVFEHLLLILLNGLAHSDHRENHFFVVNCWHGIMYDVLCTMELEGKDRKKM